VNRPKKLIAPVDGRTVFKEDGTTELKAKGEMLAVTPFWRRRQRDGDVTIADRPARTPGKGADK